MLLKQYYLGCLAHASYLIADEQSKEAAIVDPQRDIEQYLKDAAEGGYSIKYVILTHFHADFLAGHIELRNRAGARIVMGSQAKAEFDFLNVTDGQTIDMGRVRLKFLETPGHTPEGISVLVYDLNKSDNKPEAVLTGDTLFIGDVGRPDLLASIGVTADELAEMLFNSVNRLRELPEETLVYPAHGAGSLCGKGLSKETVSTIGEQKKFNYALQPMGLDEFRKLVTADQPAAPEYFVYDAIKNRQERDDLEATMRKSMRGLSVDEVLAMQLAGAQVVDVREAADYEGAHLVGSLNIGLKGKYATWCGTILSHDQPLIVVAEAGEEEEAVMRLGRIGFDNVTGYLKDGMAALSNRPELVNKIERVTALALKELLSEKRPPVVLDVRAEKEWLSGHIEGSLNIPLPQLANRLDEISSNVPVVVHCEGGYRSAIACSILAQTGRANMSDMVGGIKAWIASKLPTTAVEACESSCGSSCSK
jgi:hydroxyacylglutathione hydrolase